MGSQERVLSIAVRLLKGEKLAKRDLMDEYDKQEATIRRDISVIEMIFANADLSLGRTHSGEYWLDGDRLSNGTQALSDEEITAILMILLASRGLPSTELSSIFTKLLAMAQAPGDIRALVANDDFLYRGVTPTPLLQKIGQLGEIIRSGAGLAFDYTRDGHTRHFERWPSGLFFSDLYFYMVSGGNEAGDDPMRGRFNRFRVANMTNFKLLPRHKQDYAARFQPGELHRQTVIPYLGEPIAMTIEYLGDTSYVSDRFPDTKVLARKGQLSRLAMRVNDGYGIRMWLLSQAGLVRVLHPQHIRDYVIRCMQDTLTWYKTGTPVDPLHKKQRK